MQRLTPKTDAPSSFVTVNMRRADHVRLRAIAQAENAPIHKVIAGLLNYYENTEKAK